MTLLEIALVMAVLVVVAALVMPALRNPLQNQQLRKSADLIRAEWARARNEAMRTGRTLVFRCQVGGRGYELAPWYSANDYLELDEQSASRASAEALGLTPDLTRANELPESISFVSGAAVTSERSLPVQEALLNAAAGQGWSDPILFYPDGTTSTAQVVLGNPQGRAVVLQLRGLTGIARISDIISLQP